MSKIADTDDWNTNWTAQERIAKSNPAQNFRHRLICFLVDKLEPKDCLDIGCGSGDLLARMREKREEILLLGLEGSKVGTQLTQQKVPSALVWNVDLSADTQSWPSEVRGISAECAVLSEVLEHVDDPVGLLKKCYSLLSNNGFVIVTVPGGPRTAFDKAIGHRRHYTRSTLKQLLVDAGFRDVKVSAPGFPFFNLYKLVVFLRGDRLMSDIADFNDGSGRLAVIVMRLFNILLRITPRAGRLGWQLIAVAQRGSH